MVYKKKKNLKRYSEFIFCLFVLFVCLFCFFYIVLFFVLFCFVFCFIFFWFCFLFCSVFLFCFVFFVFGQQGRFETNYLILWSHILKGIKTLLLRIIFQLFMDSIILALFENYTITDVYYSSVSNNVNVSQTSFSGYVCPNFVSYSINIVLLK